MPHQPVLDVSSLGTAHYLGYLFYRPLDLENRFALSPKPAYGGQVMRSHLTLILVLGLAASACAKEPHHYHSGKLLQMASVPCGVAEKDAKTLTGELLGTDSSHKKTEEVLCQEYILETDTVTYRIRPKDDKHPVLLPVGQQAQFFLSKDKMVMRVEDLDNKDREYFVVSMIPRETESADSRQPARPKLQ